jgi:hypothetical protein
VLLFIEFFERENDEFFLTFVRKHIINIFNALSVCAVKETKTKKMNNVFLDPNDPNLLEHIEERLSHGRTTCCQWYARTEREFVFLLLFVQFFSPKF